MDASSGIGLRGVPRPTKGSAPHEAADRVIAAERAGNQREADYWHERLARIIDRSAAHRTELERLDLYHAELSDARKR